MEEAERIASNLGYPVVIRPAYTLGGTGGGLVYNREELRAVAARGIAASMVGQILVEESVLGWEELELEVVRDSKNQISRSVFIENIDATACTTGEILLRRAHADDQPGSCRGVCRNTLTTSWRQSGHRRNHVQFAHEPKDGRVRHH